MDCARAIVQSGLKQLVALKPDLQDPMWGEDFRYALDLLEEGGVEVRFMAAAVAGGS
jgi:dCMP deaminase